VLEYRLHVPEIVDQIGKNDDVEDLIENQFVCVSLDEKKSRIPIAGAREHLAGKIDAYADGRLKRRQKIALGASQLQHAQTGRDKVSVDLDQPSSITSAETLSRVTSAGEGIPMRDSVLPMDLGGRIDNGSDSIVHLQRSLPDIESPHKHEQCID
jgi:hypothetical protein